DCLHPWKRITLEDRWEVDMKLDNTALRSIGLRKVDYASRTDVRSFPKADQRNPADVPVTLFRLRSGFDDLQGSEGTVGHPTCLRNDVGQDVDDYVCPQRLSC